MHETPLTGLVLTGGGARAAYQAGVLHALVKLRREAGADPRRNPFGVITGTSAGAINAAALACQADRFDAAASLLHRIWREMQSEQVYRADALGVIRSGAQWLTLMSLGWMIAQWRRAVPRSLLDNEPLAGLLARTIKFERLPRLLADGHLHAVAITASSYSSGEHVSFFQARGEQAPWTRSQRVAVETTLTVPHLLASSAIPFVFPASALPREDRQEWFGDGSMRQTAPLAPAIHLGARRLMIIGAGRMHEPPAEVPVSSPYPALAQVAGHALSGIFLDALLLDVERMERINHTLSLLPPEARAHTPLQPIEALVISPSQRLDDVAARHQHRLPAPVRGLLRGLGVSGHGQSARGAALASYLLFETAFTQELIALGEADLMARRDEVEAFFGLTRRSDRTDRWRAREPDREAGRPPPGSG